jgi:hypothetical protein
MAIFELETGKDKAGFLKSFFLKAGANLTIVIYNATSSLL